MGSFGCVLRNCVVFIYFSIVRVVEPRRKRWAEQVAWMGKKRNTYRILVGKPFGKQSFGKPRRRWKDDIKMELREIGCEDEVVQLQLCAMICFGINSDGLLGSVTGKFAYL
jgi:hypothetical protein